MNKRLEVLDNSILNKKLPDSGVRASPSNGDLLDVIVEFFQDEVISRLDKLEDRIENIELEIVTERRKVIK